MEVLHMGTLQEQQRAAMKRIHYFQHVPFEALGSIEKWIINAGYALSATRFFEDSPRLPRLDALDWLIVMGGPMNVDEERTYPWLREEKQIIAQAVQSGKVVLGICLGAQLIASALGAKVGPNACKEIGWLPVDLCPQVRSHPLVEGFPASWVTFHWHGDTFELPAGALPLASSEGCRNQGFIFSDRVVGLQFHPEMTPQGTRSLVAQCAAELVPGPYIQAADRILDEAAPFALNQRLIMQLLDRLDALDH
jgi:GMP synthase-like glutamine amidotransferase